MSKYNTLHVENGADIKLWTNGVPVEDDARKQLMNTAKMPFIFKHLAVMPDVHLGKGSTIGSVIPTEGAIIPAAVGVDIGWSSDINLKPRSLASLSQAQLDISPRVIPLLAASGRIFPLESA